jgi:hypothetical protein
MYIRCPECGRKGHLPDHLVPGARTLRCRKCRAMFKPTEMALLAAERGAGGVFDPIAGVGRSDEPASFLTDGYFSGFDHSPLPPREPGPGDSNYELTFTLRDAEGESDSDWDADTADLVPEAPSSDEIPVLSTATTTTTGPEPWYQRFISTGALVLIAGALVLVVLSLAMVSYLLWRTFASGVALDLPTSTLIVGFSCATAILLLSVPIILLAVCLAELVRDLRGLSEKLEPRISTGRR